MTAPTCTDSLSGATSEVTTDRSTAVLLGFARALRQAGLQIGADRSRSFVAATAAVGATAPGRVYWAGRATLCSSGEDITVYDRAFEAWFSEHPEPTGRRPSRPPQTVRQAALTEGGATATGEDIALAAASDAEVLQHRDIAALSPAERRHLATLFETLEVVVPTRRGHRHRPAHRGRIDLRATLRSQLANGGELGRLSFRTTRRRQRPVLLLLDVSGSMAPYADALLRLAHTITRAEPARTETFTLATRLTRVTPAMRLRDPDEAITQAGAMVPDWSGGTRLGELLRAFNDRWGQRGAARGAVTVIISDGWERGDPALLGDQVSRLSRLGHALIWMNPHRGKRGYRPVQGGISACLPHLDHFLAGHSMASFAQLLRVIADA